MSLADVYGVVKVRIWSTGSFKRLSKLAPSGQALWLYLLTCPHAKRIPGVILCPREYMMVDLGWTAAKLMECFGELEHEQMVVCDWDSNLVWLVNALEENPPANPNVVTSWGGVWKMLPKCALRSRIYAAIEAHVSNRSSEFSTAFGKAFVNGCDTVPEPLGEPVPSPIPETRPKPEPSTSRARDTYTPEFEAFWTAYPRKAGKAAAFGAYQKATKTGTNRPTQETLLASVEEHKRCRQWVKDEGQFIPHPATWLNQRRWEDKPEPMRKAGYTQVGAKEVQADEGTCEECGKPLPKGNPNRWHRKCYAFALGEAIDHPDVVKVYGEEPCEPK